MNCLINGGFSYEVLGKDTLSYMRPMVNKFVTPLETSISNTFRILPNNSLNIMALPISSVPVLTGEVAERFVDICEKNSKYLSSTEYDIEREIWVKNILQRRVKYTKTPIGNRRCRTFN